MTRRIFYKKEDQYLLTGLKCKKCGEDLILDRQENEMFCKTCLSIFAVDTGNEIVREYNRYEHEIDPEEFEDISWMKEATRIDIMESEKNILEDLINEEKKKICSDTLDKMYNDKTLSTGKFEFTHDGSAIISYTYRFEGLRDMLEKLRTCGRSSDIYLTSRIIDDDPKAVRYSIRLNDSHPDHLTLYLGDYVKFDYLAQIIKEYGLQFDISNLQKVIDDKKENSYSKSDLVRLRNFLIMAGGVPDIPLSKMNGFEEYLEKEEEYARILHEAHKGAVEYEQKLDPNKVLTPDVVALTAPFDIMVESGKHLFFEMGRAMYNQFRKERGSK